MTAPRKIPITAITGFLGAGKTTLINYILEHNQGLKIGVVVNDYGAINIDAALIADQTDTMLELTNGCMCCSMEGLELDEAIGQFAYVGSPIDYIIIEASGLAEPADLHRTLKEASGRLTQLDSIVAVIDALNLEKNAKTHTTALQQLEYSDFVIINKTDLVDEARVASISELALGINNRIRIFKAIKCQVDVRLLLGQDLRSDTPALHPPNHSQHEHLHEQYQAHSYSTEEPLDPLAFQNFTNHQIPSAIYRAKGIVNLGKKGHRRKYVFQLVGKRAELTWEDWGDNRPITQLVFIGMDFDRNELTRLLDECIDVNPDNLDPSKEVILPKRQR